MRKIEQRTPNTERRPGGLSRPVRRWMLLLLALPVLLPLTVYAHAGHVDSDRPWYLRWNFDGIILLSLALLSFAYARGLNRLWKRAGIGRGGVSRWRAVAFGGGMAALFIALVSPMDPMADELSWVHMIQHMMLMMVAAPLMVMGSPGLVFLWSLPPGRRKQLGTKWYRAELWRPPRYLLWQPLATWGIFAFTLWVWHIPTLYQAALRNQWIHDFQHLTFFATSCLFWRVLLDPISRLRLSRGVGVIYLFTTSLHATLLGVFMALSPRVWYADYEPRAPLWGLTALEDQQLAGLIMWMPACAIYAVVAAVLFGIWLREPDRYADAASAIVEDWPCEEKGDARA